MTDPERLAFERWLNNGHCCDAAENMWKAWLARSLLDTPAQGADARPVADAREALTDSVVEQWLDRQGNDSGQGLCDMYTSAVRDGYRLARSTLTDFYATRDAAPIDAKVIGYVNTMWAEHRKGSATIYPESHPRLATFPLIAASAPREAS
jgi:hypothetical protein